MENIVKINRRRSYGKSSEKERSPGSCDRRMRRTGKIIPRIGKTKSHLPIDKVGIKRYDKRKENGVKGHLRYDKITDPKICVYQIHSHYVQLYFVSMAYGIMMEDAGFKWYYSLLVSLTVYTGAFQFVLITFLSSGALL